MSPSVVVARSVTVRYGATLALDAIDVDVRAGEVHAVVGENGAGKSTLLRALAGVVRRTSGTIDLQAGIRLAWVPQETTLPPDLTASEWIFLGCELRRAFGWLRSQAMDVAAGVALSAVGCHVAPQARIGVLPLPQRKQVQVARAVRGEPRLLLLDEPTAVLGEAETRALFATIRTLRQRGAGVLYVSHRLDEVLAIADRITVLRDGRLVSTDDVHAVDSATLVQRMVGRDVPLRQRTDAAAGTTLLDLLNLSVAHVHGVSLTVRGGEVVGLAGLIGAGRSEVLEAIAGLRPARGGRVVCSTAPLFVPEDRGSKGLVAALGLRENLCLPADAWLLHQSSERRVARQWIERLAIRASGTEAAIDTLSGGNQQKLLLARALRHAPRLLLLDEPTAGVDVGAKAEIHDHIRELAAGGTAILLASSDLPELLTLCDRILALREGRVAASVDAASASEARLAALITGAAEG